MIIKKPNLRLSIIVYGLYCALLPFNMVLNFTGFTINRYVGILAAFLFLYDIFTRRINNIKYKYLIFIVFYFWCLITYIWSINQDHTFSSLKTLLSLVFLSSLLLIRRVDQNELRFIKYCMIIPAASVVFYLAPNLSISYSRETIETSAGVADHNSLAANMVFPLLIAIDEIRIENNKEFKIISIISTVLLIIGLLLIASRGAIFATFIGIIVYFVNEMKGSGVRIHTRKIIISMFSVALIILGIFVLLKYVDLPAIGRLQLSSIYEDKGTGRFSLWIGFWDAIWSSPIRFLIGYGFGTETDISSSFLGREIGAHNVYLEIWATCGCVGLLLLLCVFMLPVLDSINNYNSLGMALIISLMVICFPLGFLLNKGAWNILTLVLLFNITDYSRSAKMNNQDLGIV